MSAQEFGGSTLPPTTQQVDPSTADDEESNSVSNVISAFPQLETKRRTDEGWLIKREVDAEQPRITIEVVAIMLIWLGSVCFGTLAVLNLIW